MEPTTINKIMLVPMGHFNLVKIILTITEKLAVNFL